MSLKEKFLLCPSQSILQTFNASGEP